MKDGTYRYDGERMGFSGHGHMFILMPGHVYELSNYRRAPDVETTIINRKLVSTSTSHGPVDVEVQSTICVRNGPCIQHNIEKDFVLIK